MFDKILEALQEGEHYLLTLGYTPGAEPQQRVFKILEMTEKYPEGPGWFAYPAHTPGPEPIEHIREHFEGAVYISLARLEEVLVKYPGDNDDPTP